MTWATEEQKTPEVLGSSGARTSVRPRPGYSLSGARLQSRLRFTRPWRYRSFAQQGLPKVPIKVDGHPTSKEAANELNQGRPVRSVRGLTEAAVAFFLVKRAAVRGRALVACCKRSQHLGLGSRDARLRQSPDLDRLIARAHGDPAIIDDMNAALRTAGCPSAERNLLTQPTGAASPVLTRPC